MHMKKLIIIAVIAILAGYWLVGRQGDTGPSGGFMMDEQAVILSGTAQLRAVGEYTGSGTATRKWDGTTFLHTVSAAIGAPAEGKFYEGWLVRPEPFEFVSTGRLEATDDGYGLTFVMERDFREHVNVVITEETEANGLDGIPEAHVLEGSF